MNNDLLRLHAQLQRAGAGTAASLRSQAAPIIAQRSSALSALIEQNPSEALQLAFSPDLVANLATAFPQWASQFESHGVWQAEIEYYVIDDPTMTVHHSVIRMTDAQETLEIHFSSGEPPGLKCGDILRVEGVRVGNRVAAAGGTVVGSSLAAATCSTTGVQRIAVLLVTFPNVTPSVSPQTVYDVFFAASGRSVDGFWRENSYGQTSATGDVFGWYTLSQTYTCDQYYQMRAAAIEAADPEVYFPDYTRIFIILTNPGG